MFKEQHFQGSRGFLEVNCHSKKHRGIGLVYQKFIDTYATPEQVEEARRAAFKHEAECDGRVVVTYYDNEQATPENDQNAPLNGNAELIPDPFDSRFPTLPKKETGVIFDYGWQANDEAALIKVRQIIAEEIKKNGNRKSNRGGRTGK